MFVLYLYMQGRHALIIFEGARVGGGGGGSSCDTQQPQQHLCFIYFIFIWNIPKCINYIMKYLDSHLYRLAMLVHLVGDGQIT